MNFGTKATDGRYFTLCVSPQVKEELAPCSTSLKTMLKHLGPMREFIGGLEVLNPSIGLIKLQKNFTWHMLPQNINEPENGSDLVERGSIIGSPLIFTSHTPYALESLLR